MTAPRRAARIAINALAAEAGIAPAAAGADYNLSPSRWVGQTEAVTQRPITEIIAEIRRLDEEAREVDARLTDMLARLQ